MEISSGRKSGRDFYMYSLPTTTREFPLLLPPLPEEVVVVGVHPPSLLKVRYYFGHSAYIRRTSVIENIMTLRSHGHGLLNDNLAFVAGTCVRGGGVVSTYIPYVR